MVKKLRNRDVSTPTDEELSSPISQKAPNYLISKNQLRRKLKRKFHLSQTSKPILHKTFTNHLLNGQLCEIFARESLQCSICLQLMVSPSLMQCGHAYCQRCLQSNQVYNKRCCLCRDEQGNQTLVSSKFLQKIIIDFVLQKGEETIEYLCRLTDFQEWRKRRYLGNYKKNLVVDFQDRLGAWRRAVITQLIPTQEGMNFKVRYNIKGLEFMEAINASSNRIAPFTFFTRLRYLQQFQPSLPEGEYQQNQLQSLQYRQSALDGDEDLWMPRQSNDPQSPQQNIIQEQAQRPHLLQQLFDFQMNQNFSLLF